jgi:hypothetical protein
MTIKYFVKFIGDRNVTLAKARDHEQEQILRHNNYEETTEEFYQWVRSETQPVKEQ